ncbi:A24 family peptidase [Bilifractor porci]|uniref:Prepilin peptidase n=1 Tax=Bilifractor porci TaxID=2606636 RepID=A0A7X2P8A8_9FIRM|nr:A24 family peptidase [Bilifractor porci]MST81621.1 prepilin peptidase [Bilifractor porci]
MTAEHALALMVCSGSALLDLDRMKLPNGWIFICALLAVCQRLADFGPPGLGAYFAGAAVPFLLLFPVWLVLYRSVGAGDIKLLMVIGGILGPSAILRCVFRTFLFGAAFSVLLLFSGGSFLPRIQYLTDYLKKVCGHGIRKTSGRSGRPVYRKTGEYAESVHMTIPVLMSVLLWIGGV